MHVCTVLNLHTQDNINKQEAVQRLAVCFVVNSYQNTSSINDLINQLQWPRGKVARLAVLRKIINDEAVVNKDCMIVYQKRTDKTKTETFSATKSDSVQNSILPELILPTNHQGAE